MISSGESSGSAARACGGLADRHSASLGVRLEILPDGRRDSGDRLPAAGAVGHDDDDVRAGRSPDDRRVVRRTRRSCRSCARSGVPSGKPATIPSRNHSCAISESISSRESADTPWPAAIAIISCARSMRRRRQVVAVHGHHGRRRCSRSVASTRLLPTWSIISRASGVSLTTIMPLIASRIVTRSPGLISRYSSVPRSFSAYFCSTSPACRSRARRRRAGGTPRAAPPP